MSQLETQILHQDYVLTCPDGQEAQLLEAVERVEQQFELMRDKSKLRSRERIGVLLAVNLAYENLELRKQLQDLQAQLAHVQSAIDLDEVPTDTTVQMAGVDADRMEQLEHIAAQYATDLVMAQQLIQRLDDVLTQQTSDATEIAPSDPAHDGGQMDAQAVPESDSELALTETDTQEAAETAMPEPILATTTDLDSHSDGDLLPNTAETR
jgi:cell division protein ZapA